MKTTLLLPAIAAALTLAPVAAFAKADAQHRATPGHHMAHRTAKSTSAPRAAPTSMPARTTPAPTAAPKAK